MANVCSFDMKIVGLTEQDILEALKVIQEEDYDKPHLSRIFSASLESIEYDDFTGLWQGRITGSCAWSVQSCCTDASLSYFESNEEERGKDGFDPNVRCLPQICIQHNVGIEVFSWECGECFQEHYAFSNTGRVIISDCEDYSEHYWDRTDYPTLEEYNKEFGTSYKEEDFNECDTVVEGGFANPYSDEDEWPWEDTQTFFIKDECDSILRSISK